MITAVNLFYASLSNQGRSQGVIRVQNSIQILFLKLKNEFFTKKC